MDAVEKNQPEKCQQIQKRCSEVVEVEISSAESINKPVSCPRRQSWYFRICEGLLKKWRVGHCYTSCLFALSFSVVTCGMWPSTDRGVVKTSRSVKKSMKFFLKSLDTFPQNFAPAKISCYMVYISCCEVIRMAAHMYVCTYFSTAITHLTVTTDRHTEWFLISFSLSSIFAS